MTKNILNPKSLLTNAKVANNAVSYPVGKV